MIIQNNSCGSFLSPLRGQLILSNHKIGETNSWLLAGGYYKSCCLQNSANSSMNLVGWHQILETAQDMAYQYICTWSLNHGVRREVLHPCYCYLKHAGCIVFSNRNNPLINLQHNRAKLPLWQHVQTSYFAIVASSILNRTKNNDMN